MSELPKRWIQTRLGEIVDLNPRHSQAQVSDETLVNFLPMPSVEAETGRIDLSRIRPWMEVKKGYTNFQNGDVLFAKITPCMENGKVAVCSELNNGIGAGSTEFHVLRPKSSLESKYVLFYLLQQSVRRDARRVMQGAAGQLRVPTSFLANLQIPLPPLPEQRRIVAEIEKQFTRISEVIQNFENNLKKLDLYRKIILDWATTGKLSQQWRSTQKLNDISGFQLLKTILSSRRLLWETDEIRMAQVKGTILKGEKWKLNYKPPIHPLTSEMPPLPQSWTYATLQELSSPNRESMKTGPFGTALGKTDYRGEGIPIIGIENIGANKFIHDYKKFISPEKFATLASYAVRSNDLIVSRSGTVGEVCVIPNDVEGVMSTNLIRIRINQTVANPQFIALIFIGSNLLSKQLSDLYSGSTREFLNHEILQKLILPIPPVSEQGFIVQSVSKFESLIESMRATIKRTVSEAKLLRQAILAQAFSGQLVPQDPSDEPAAALLERIRSHRPHSSSKRTSRCP